MTPDRRAGLARHLVPVALAIAAALALAGAALAAESPAPTGTAGAAPSGGTPISIVQKTFQPANVTIHAGDTVTWTVTEAISDPHAVTSGTPADTKPGTVFDSGLDFRKNGDSFSHTFDVAGAFPFFCPIHPETMTGMVTVLEAGAGGAGASEHTAVDTGTKLIAVGILAAALVVLFGWAWLYRRINPAP